MSGTTRETIEIAKRNGIVHPIVWDSPHFFVADALYPGAARDLLDLGQDKMFQAVNDLLMYTHNE